MHKAVLLALAVVLLAGCAEVKVRKVVTDTSNPHGKADGPSGLRFYMPRPYIAVNEPFIVSARSFLVGGELSIDNQYVLINDVARSDADFNRIFLGSTSGKKIPASAIPLRSSGAARAETGKQESKSDDQAAAPKSGTSESGSTKTEEQSGILNLKATNDNTSYAMTPLRRYFDIVWLPDFTEQYVVETKAGLGNASVTLGLGQGWSFQGIEAKVDNSALTRRILDVIDSGTQIGLALGKRALGLPGSEIGKQQSLESPAAGGKTARDLKAGTPLTLKVTLVRVAAPGLYPLLKPGELEAMKASLTDEDRRRILVPVPPMTSIAFNTYDTVVVEAALARDDSPLRLHQYVLGVSDLRPGSLSSSKDGEVESQGTDDQYAKLRNAMNEALKKFDADDSKWRVIAVKQKNTGSKNLVATVQSTGAPKGSEADVMQELAAAAKAAGFSLADPDVTIKK